MTINDDYQSLDDTDIHTDLLDDQVEEEPSNERILKDFIELHEINLEIKRGEFV
jgi:hypothetical protein